MRWPRRFLAGAALLVLLAATVVYHIPLDAYVPEIERALGAGLNQPVKVGHLEVGVAPLPHLALEDVQIGGPQGISLKSAKAIFDIRSLFQKQRVIHKIILKNGSVTLAQLENIFAWLQSGTTGPPPIRIEELQLGGIRIVMPQFVIEPLEGRLEFTPDSRLARATFSLPGDRLSATLNPLPGDAYAISAKLAGWPVPGYPAIRISGLNVSGILSEQWFCAREFSADVSGAHLGGRALLEWKPEWNIVLHLDTVDGRLERVLPPGPVAVAGSLHGKASLGTRGAELRSLPRKMKMDAELEIRNVTVNVPGSTHRALALDSIAARMSGTLSEIALSGLQIKLYGGTAGGSAVVRGGGAALHGDIAFGGIAVEPLVQALTSEVLLSGMLDGKARFSIKPKESASFPQNLQLDGEFRIRDGVLRKLDMVQAASNPLKEGNKGGTTSFDELSSLLAVDAAGYHFRGLKVSSGALRAEGRLDVSPQQQLSGLLDTNVRGTGSLISMPLVVSGTSSDPVLRPPKSVLAGASVGTALMGPGVGTALGIKAGSLLNKLFGKKNETENKPAK